MAFIQREDGDRGDVFAWWDGSELDAETQFSCDVNEVILVLDAESEDLVATLGPGRHALPPALKRLAGQGEVLVIFVTTGPMGIEAGGALDDLADEPWVEIKARVTVRDAAKAIELLPLLDDDESPEDWLAEELILAVSHAAEAVGGDFQALQAARGSIAAAATGFANSVMTDLGFEVSTPELEFSQSDDDED